jgi:hypothetical protein
MPHNALNTSIEKETNFKYAAGLTEPGRPVFACVFNSRSQLRQCFAGLSIALYPCGLSNNRI